LDRISKSTGLKCIIESPIIPTINRDLKWTGRDSSLLELKNAVFKLLEACASLDARQKEYITSVIYGAVGVGKSRFGWDGLKIVLEELMEENPRISLGGNKICCLNEIYDLSNDHIVPLFLDFNQGQDDWISRLDGLHKRSYSIGFRLAARFFFGVGAQKLDALYPLPEAEFKAFEIGLVADKIERKLREALKIPNDKIAVMSVLFDEYQKLNDGNIKYGAKLAVEMLSMLRSATTNGKRRGLVLIPILDGTTESDAIVDVDLSSFGIRQIGLGPLNKGEDMEIIAADLGEEIANNPWCKVAVESLGQIPRYIEYFLQACKKKPIGVDRRAFFDQILIQVC
jgi:hypothetical protein